MNLSEKKARAPAKPVRAVVFFLTRHTFGTVYFDKKKLKIGTPKW